MIHIEATIRYAGYDPSTLSKGSHKRVCCICDICGRVRWAEIRAYRDLCNPCSLRTVECRTKMSLARIGITMSEETKQKMSHSSMGHKVSPQTRAKIGNAHRGKKLSDVTKQKLRSRRIGTTHTSTTRAKISALGQGRTHTAQTRHKISVAAKGLIRTMESRIKHSATLQGVSLEDWTHFAKHNPYCHKFNERFKESIREKFDRKCFMCDRTEEENRKKLSVHHVNYDKECICNGVECEFVPLCSRCHSITNFGREIWERLIMNVLSYEDWI